MKLSRITTIVAMAGLLAHAIHPAPASAQSTPIPFAIQPQDPFVRYQPEGPDLPPPNLWDIATGEEISGADVLKTKSFGVVVAGSGWGGSPADASGLRGGDIILGMDGMRTYGKREWELARFRNPLSSTMTLLINREGDLQWIKLHDLDPGRMIGVEWNNDQEQERFIDEIESLGLPVPEDRVLPALRLLPAAAAPALDLWAHSGTASNPADTAWLQEFIKLYLAVQSRHYSEAAPPAHQPPIPYFQRLEKFYLSLAAANLFKETPPDVARTGETPEFYTLALPIPFYKPSLGDVHFSDLRFNALLARAYGTPRSAHADDTVQENAEIKIAAAKYASGTGDGLERYLDAIKAGLLNARGYGALAYDSDLVQQPLSRYLLITRMQGALQNESDGDWPLVACAMIALDTQKGDDAAAFDLIQRLAKHSPALAAIAADQALRHDRVAGGFKQLRHDMNHSEGFLAADYPELYRWASEQVAPLAEDCAEIDRAERHDPYVVLIQAPYAELSALKGVKEAPPPATAPETPSPSPDDDDQ
jgi:hypothetical protein